MIRCFDTERHPNSDYYFSINASMSARSAGPYFGVPETRIDANESEVGGITKTMTDSIADLYVDGVALGMSKSMSTVSCSLPPLLG